MLTGNQFNNDVYYAHRIMRLPEVIQRVGLSRSSIYQYISEGAFPQPVKLGMHAVGWVEREIAEWLASRMHARKPRITKRAN